VALMPPHRCTVCRKLVAGRCTCRAPWSQARPAQRIRGRQLQQLRLDLFARQPWCALCWEKSPKVFTLATVRDHIIPLVEGGRDVESNTQPLCQPCSDAKSQSEAKRGQQRAR
jgi:5-methylcytosine-specific restriction enzyme A